MTTWKNIPGFGNHYQASSCGMVRVKDRIIMRKHSKSGKVERFFYKGKELSQMTFRDGYKMVRIGVDGERFTLHVGRLVLMAFVGMPPPKMECCHNDGNPANNSLKNLRWDTHYNNNQDRKRHGKYALGQRHPMAKLTLKKVLKIKASNKSGVHLAKLYGCSTSTISNIRRGSTWRHAQQKNS